MLKNKRIFSLFFAIPFFLGLFSCENSPFFQDKNSLLLKEPSLKVLSWNVQNLFDWKDDGSKYPEFRSQNYVWNKKTLYNKMERIHFFFQELSFYPDIVIFQEVESLAVIELLFSRFFKANPYPFMMGSPDKKIQVIVLSRLPFMEVEFLSLEDLPDANSREFIKVVFPWQDEIISLVGVHLKSWVGTPKRNKYIRSQELTSLGEWLEEDYQKGRIVLIVGDLNQSQEESLLGSSIGKLGDSNLFMRDLTYGREYGTYYRKKSFYWLDGALVSENLGQDKEISLEVLDFPFLKNFKGTPFFFSRYAIEGTSDHFPFLLEIKIKKDYKD